MEERRRSSRHNVLFPCIVKAGDSRANGFVVNTSRTGVSIQSSLTPDLNSEVEVSISCCCGEEVCFVGKVVRVDTGERLLALGIEKIIDSFWVPRTHRGLGPWLYHTTQPR